MQIQLQKNVSCVFLLAKIALVIVISINVLNANQALSYKENHA